MASISGVGGPAGVGGAQAGQERRGRRRGGWIGLALLALIALVGLRSELGTRLDGFTIDEPWHIVAGASYVRTGDFRLNPEHPPLAKLWVGAWMPERLLALPAPTVVQDKPQERDLVETAVFSQPDVDALQARARLAMMALNLLLLAGVVALCMRAFGWRAGVVLLVLVLVEPTVLAHLPLVMTDLPVASALVMAGLACGLLAWRWQWRWVPGAGLAIGLALAAKHSALPGVAALGLALLVLVLAGAWRLGAGEGAQRLVKLSACVLVSVCVVWASYGFRFHAGPDGSDHYNRPMADKLADLERPWMAGTVAFADRYRLLPRPYLWGLADTLRAGVDGRGPAEHRLWGVDHPGDPPLHAWPSLVVSKLPLGLAALMLLGAGALLWRRPDAPVWRPAMALLLVMAAGTLAALMASRGIYAGVRHALPLVLTLLVVAAAGLAAVWRGHGRSGFAVLAAAGLLWVGAAGATLREPRLYEFHNTLAGGSQDAWRRFRNESVDLGQRTRELARFHDEHIVPSGLPLYVAYGVMPRAEAHYLPMAGKFVASIHEDNPGASWEGWFAYRMSATEPEPRFDWDPEEVFRDKQLVARFGMLGVWRGRYTSPRGWASSMRNRVYEYVHVEGGDDWDLVARRLEETLAVDPLGVWVGIDLGNAHLRMGRREQAIAGYRVFLEHEVFPVAPTVQELVRAHIARVEAAEDLAAVAPLRNPFSE